MRKIPPNEERPEAERVEAGEGDVSGPDLQRQQVVHERRADRHDDQEDHRDAVHREDLVVEVGAEQLAVRRGELEADQQGLDAADQEEEQRRGAVHDADLLVVDGGDPAPPAGLGAGPGEDAERAVGTRPLAGGRAQRASGVGDGHRRSHHRVHLLQRLQVGDELVDLRPRSGSGSACRGCSDWSA